MERALSDHWPSGFARARRLLGQLPDSHLLRRALVTGAALFLAMAGYELWQAERPIVLLLLAGALALMLLARNSTSRDSIPEHELDQAAPPLPAQSDIVLQLAAQHGADRHHRSTDTSPASAEAWSDLMARVSHDMRTPLNAVIGFSDVMTAELFGPVGHDRYREYITHIRDSGRELLRSAEDTLAITGLIAGNAAASGDTLHLGTLIDEARAAAGAAALAVDLDDERIEITGERRAMRQTLVNLMLEAAARSQPGSRVSLEASAEDEFVTVQITVAGGQSRPRGHEASLHICMARVLLELSGARLIEIERNGVWRAVTVLGRATTQQDFFAGKLPVRAGAARHAMA